jgi:leucyl aminopeptidase (aminopeptidase T)
VAIAAARETRITTPAGTDLRILATPRSATGGCPAPGPGPNPVQCVDGECHEPGTWDESCGGVTAVLPDDAEGVVVVDHSIPPLGLLREPIRLRVEARRVTQIEGGAEAARLRQWLEETGAASAFTCPAEWGVGTHAACIDSGNFLEHEKALGAVHVALGDDRRFGGASAAPIHVDGVLCDARVELDGRVILDHGRFLL